MSISGRISPKSQSSSNARRSAHQRRSGKPSSNSNPLVCLLAYDGLCTFEFGICVELFGIPRPEFEHWYRLAIVAVETGPLRAIGGITVTADGDLDLLANADLILVPGWRSPLDPVPQNLINALRSAHERGTRVASICSGVFVLAAAGLLDGKRATTHWKYVDMLANDYPKIQVEPDVLYVDEGSVLTSAGSAAGLDLCLHIVRRDFGTQAANTVARRLVLPTQRDGGQRQFVSAPVPRERGGRIGPLLDQMRETLDEDWPIARMAQISGLTSRTLMRRFRETTGDTPLAWLTLTRVGQAAQLLETSDSSLNDIAAISGFGSPETFRREFRRLHGIPPSRYRAAFGMNET